MVQPSLPHSGLSGSPIAGTARRVLAGGVETFVREAPGAGTPTVFVHGNPDTSDTWAPFLARAAEVGRVVAPDLPGFGRSARPDPGVFDHGLAAYDAWFEALLDELAIDALRLVVHDWGGLALPAAIRRADRVERLVVIDAVPLTAAYRWHWIARAWRTPVLGELAVRAFTRPVLKLLSRLSSPRPGPQSEDFLDQATRHLDQGTRRAILGLYRSADPEVLEQAGRGLGELRCPALVVWGEGDPYVGLEQGRAYASRLPGARLEVVRGVGHWCWWEEPSVVDSVVDFLSGDSPRSAPGVPTPAAG